MRWLLNVSRWKAELLDGNIWGLSASSEANEKPTCQPRLNCIQSSSLMSALMPVEGVQQANDIGIASLRHRCSVSLSHFILITSLGCSLRRSVEIHLKSACGTMRKSCSSGT